jgi:hypothetical protein
MGRRIRLEDGTDAEIVWSGDTPARSGGHTKGELLGPYETPEGYWPIRKVKRKKHGKDEVVPRRRRNRVSSTKQKTKGEK